jgi:hypothetical protein
MPFPFWLSKMVRAAESSSASKPGSPTSGEDTSNWLEQTVDHSQKLQLADSMRLLKDNQHTLDTINAADRAYRQQQHRMRESELSRNGVKGSTPLNFADDMGDIRIDSPSYVYPQAPHNGLARTAAVLAALAIGGAGTVAAMKWLTPSAKAPSNTSTTNGFVLELVPAK